MRHAVIPVFVPHKGCPHDCIFCNQKKISGSSTDVTSKEVKKIIEEGLATIRPGTYTEIGFFGGSFTGIEKEKQLEFLETAGLFVVSGKVASIRLSTRPDYINEEILEYLKKNHVGTIELGVQSLDEEVLRISNRGHSIGDVVSAAKLIREFGFELGIQTMTGLPGDNAIKDLETAVKVIELRPSIVRIYPALVIRGTYMETMYNEGSYRPQQLEEAVELCAELLGMYEAEGIKVIRIGLQGNDSISSGPDSEVVAGPFHPAFRQLVEARLALRSIEAELEELELQMPGAVMKTASFIKPGPLAEKRLQLFTGTRNISNITGQKRSNIEYLKKKYGFREVSVKAFNDESNITESAMISDNSIKIVLLD
ncbi:MAG: radical SAM protein [Clostridiales bacterium]|nr:radical SAM protein [Clostridiales bacterium]